MSHKTDCDKPMNINAGTDSTQMTGGKQDTDDTGAQPVYVHTSQLLSHYTKPTELDDNNVRLHMRCDAIKRGHSDETSGVSFLAYILVDPLIPVDYAYHPTANIRSMARTHVDTCLRDKFKQRCRKAKTVRKARILCESLVRVGL